MKPQKRKQSSDEEDDIWEYKSKQHSKSTAETVTSSEIVKERKTKLRNICNTVKSKDKSREIKRQKCSKDRADKFVTEETSSVSSTNKTTSKSKKYAASDKGRRGGGSSKKKQTPLKQKEHYTGFCPACQMPLSILNVQTPTWHVSECLESFESSTECPEGLHCDSTIESHYRKYSHHQLAKARAHPELEYLPQTDKQRRLSAKVRLEFDETQDGVIKSCSQSENAQLSEVRNNICSQSKASQVKVEVSVAAESSVVVSISCSQENKQKSPGLKNEKIDHSQKHEEVACYNVKETIKNAEGSIVPKKSKSVEDNKINENCHEIFEKRKTRSQTLSQNKVCSSQSGCGRNIDNNQDSQTLVENCEKNSTKKMKMQSKEKMIHSGEMRQDLKTCVNDNIEIMELDPPSSPLDLSQMIDRALESDTDEEVDGNSCSQKINSCDSDSNVDDIQSDEEELCGTLFDASETSKCQKRANIKINGNLSLNSNSSDGVTDLDETEVYQMDFEADPFVKILDKDAGCLTNFDMLDKVETLKAPEIVDLTFDQDMSDDGDDDISQKSLSQGNMKEYMKTGKLTPSQKSDNTRETTLNIRQKSTSKMPKKRKINDSRETTPIKNSQENKMNSRKTPKSKSSSASKSDAKLRKIQSSPGRLTNTSLSLSQPKKHVSKTILKDNKQTSLMTFFKSKSETSTQSYTQFTKLQKIEEVSDNVNDAYDSKGKETAETLKGKKLKNAFDLLGKGNVKVEENTSKMNSLPGGFIPENESSCSSETGTSKALNSGKRNMRNASTILMKSRNPERSSEVKNECKTSASTAVPSCTGIAEADVKDVVQQNSGKRYRQCPFYKKIPDTSFTVDAFNYGDVPGCKAYFLSHFHYDHYNGLRKSFSNEMYCSKITANLVKSKIKVDSRYIHELPMNTPVVIEGVQVTLLEANHCPGSVLILFKLKSGRVILHTGDFRADPSMEQYPELTGIKVNQLYLDTTYCDPAYAFPIQQEAIEFGVSLALKSIEVDRNTLIVCGSYTIGKERIFIAIAKALNCKICVMRDKKNILDCLEDQFLQNRVSLNWEDSQLHVLPMVKLNQKGLREHASKLKRTYTSILALEPTGWTYNSKVGSLDQIKPKFKREEITIYGVPYSEHSSFLELKRFVQFFKPDKILPTVNNGNPNTRKKMELIFKSWKDEQCNGQKPVVSNKQASMSKWLV